MKFLQTLKAKNTEYSIANPNWEAVKDEVSLKEKADLALSDLMQSGGEISPEQQAKILSQLKTPPEMLSLATANIGEISGGTIKAKDGKTVFDMSKGLITLEDPEQELKPSDISLALAIKALLYHGFAVQNCNVNFEPTSIPTLSVDFQVLPPKGSPLVSGGAKLVASFLEALEQK